MGASDKRLLGQDLTVNSDLRLHQAILNEVRERTFPAH
jgi:hypothetical protein